MPMHTKARICLCSGITILHISAFGLVCCLYESICQRRFTPFALLVLLLLRLA